MAGNKQHKQAYQQLTPLNLTGQQHERQGQQRDNPGVDRQHDPDLCGLHTKTLCDVGKQTHGDKFCGIENKRSNSQRNDP